MVEYLIIPTTFEEMSEDIKYNIEQLSQIIQPVIKAEEDVNIILKNIRHTGYTAFLLGNSGTGKSTFLASLKWRSHIAKRALINIDASEALPAGGLNELYNRINKVSIDSIKEKDKGPTILVIDYLESLSDFELDDIKGFFRNLNGLLRKCPLLIIWPVTSREEVDSMMEIAKVISTTMFYPEFEVLNFDGPNHDSFIDITKRTISYLNSGKDPSEFGLTSDTFEEVKKKFDNLPLLHKNIRKYLQMIRREWEINSEYIQKLKISIPKPIEVWFVFSYPKAESIVSHFTRKGQTVEEAWSALHDKFYEYIPNSQRSSIWDASRLQLALYGYIKTRIMYLPTNALVSSAMAYCDDPKLTTEIETFSPPSFWKQPSKARGIMSTTPMTKQILGEKFQVGFRKGGPAIAAIEKATPIFSAINKLITKKVISDTIINKSIAVCLKELTGYNIEAQVKHPWLERITPDILVELPEKTISIEFHHTDDDAPHIIADYVLSKLNTYMNQIEEKMKT